MGMGGPVIRGSDSHSIKRRSVREAIDLSPSMSTTPSQNISLASVTTGIVSRFGLAVRR